MEKHFKGAYKRTFPCMEANYRYAIKNQQGVSNGGILRSKALSRGLWMPERVLYGISHIAGASITREALDQ